MTEDALIGRTLGGKYVVEACLGMGGFGAVYRARQVPVNRAVAVKVVRPGLGDPEGATRKRFLREATALAKLQNRAVALLHDFGEEADGLLYMVQEFADGRDLAEVLKKEGRLPALRVVDLGAAVLEALVEAHALGIVHRDIKPANIMLVPSKRGGEQVKLVDFGLAKAPMDGGGMGAITAEDHIPGTPAYMAPEIWNQAPLTGAADQYALAIVLYRAVAGRLPFENPTLAGLMQEHLYDPPPPLPAGVPEALEAVVMRGLSKRASDRYPNAAAMRAALLRALPDETVPLEDLDRDALALLLDGPPTPRPPPPPPAFAAQAAAVVVDSDIATAPVPQVSEPTPEVRVVRPRWSPWQVGLGLVLLATLLGALLAAWWAQADPPPAPPPTVPPLELQWPAAGETQAPVRVERVAPVTVAPAP